MAPRVSNAASSADDGSGYTSFNTITPGQKSRAYSDRAPDFVRLTTTAGCPRLTFTNFWKASSSPTSIEVTLRRVVSCSTSDAMYPRPPRTRIGTFSLKQCRATTSSRAYRIARAVRWRCSTKCSFSMPFLTNALGKIPAKTFRDAPTLASSCFHAVHELDQTRCVFLGAYVIFEIGNSEDQAVAPALAIEADKSRIPAESALMPLIGQRVGVFLASRVQEKHTDDRHSQYVPADKTNDGKRSTGSEGVA